MKHITKEAPRPPKRSSYRKHTRQGEVLRYLRISKRISMRRAGELNDCSSSLINHYENGRADIVESRVLELVTSYGYTMTEFEEYLGGKLIPVTDLRRDCEEMLGRIDEARLRAVHAVLVGFISGS